MSTREDERDAPVDTAEGADEEPKRKLDLQVEISEAGPCKKHLKVAISAEEIKRQFEESLGSFRKEAQVPGFRPGRAPRTLVERRFKKEVAGQVKSALLLAALEQLDEDYDINPITQPDLDVEAIELPDDGPLAFELDVEVEPDFEMPAYKALTVQRPVKEITEADVEAQLQSFLERYAQMVPRFEGAAELGDFITADLAFRKDGRTLNEVKEVQFRLRPELRFQDGRVPSLDDALLGARPGDVRTAKAELGSASADPTLRNQVVDVTFTVHDLKTLRLPEVNRTFLDSIGFDSVEDLRTALRGVLERRIAYQQRQAIRRSILDQLLDATPFDLPADLVARQERSTLRNHVQEMRQAGFSDSEIRAREAEVRANAHEATLRNLKEFFILSKIAEAEDIKVDDADVALEIEGIAMRTDESPRRVRARIEKEGLMEGLMSQILERKAIDRILEYTKVEDVAFVEERAAEAVDQAATPEGEPEGQEGDVGAPAEESPSEAKG